MSVAIRYYQDTIRKFTFQPRVINIIMIKNLKGSLIIIVLLSLLFSGCEMAEPPKKVSLENRSTNSAHYIPGSNADCLKFGFDLRLGPKEDVRIYLPFLRYIERAVGKKFCLQFTEKYEDTIKDLGSGITQFAALGPVSCVLAKKRYNVDCLVMGLNAGGKAEYSAFIFTGIDSPLTDIRDLKGKSFAFGDRFSTQGHIIPRKMLEDTGIFLQDLNSYAFTGSHANTARAVLKGDFDAGGIQDNLAKRLLAEGKIKVLGISEPYPSSLICYNTNIDPGTLKAVETALLAFDPQGRHANILVNWQRTEMPNGFTNFSIPSLKKISELSRKYGLLQ